MARGGRIAWPALAAALVLLTVACGSPAAPAPLAGTTSVVGTVHFYTVEGGFWAVHGDDGVTYDPLGGLPSTFQRENLRVRMIVRIRDDLSGVHMVGPIVEIVAIREV